MLNSILSKLKEMFPASPFFVLENYTLTNLQHIIVAKYKKFIKHQYTRHFNDNKVDDMLYAVFKCPDCYENNSAKCCGCSFKDMILSDKKCKLKKW